MSLAGCAYAFINFNGFDFEMIMGAIGLISVITHDGFMRLVPQNPKYNR
jgi:hypothetical protein